MWSDRTDTNKTIQISVQTKKKGILLINNCIRTSVNQLWMNFIDIFSKYVTNG